MSTIETLLVKAHREKLFINELLQMNEGWWVCYLRDSDNTIFPPGSGPSAYYALLCAIDAAIAKRPKAKAPPIGLVVRTGKGASLLRELGL